jgi:hypothetical protein
MCLKSVSIAFLLAVSIALPSRAALLISEVLANEVGSDVTGEWIEIFNTGPASIDLTNYKIGDEETSGGTGTTEALQQFPAGASIGPGVVQIVAVSATKFFSLYGFLPTYESSATDPSVPDLLPYTTWDPDGTVINMANGGDQALILDGSDTLVDGVSWGTSTFFLNPAIAVSGDGQSYERIDPYVDTNTAGDWQLGSPSSPGVVVPEPAGLVLLFAAMLIGLFGPRRCAG